MSGLERVRKSLAELHDQFLAGTFRPSEWTWILTLPAGCHLCVVDLRDRDTFPSHLFQWPFPEVAPSDIEQTVLDLFGIKLINNGNGASVHVP